MTRYRWLGLGLIAWAIYYLLPLEYRDLWQPDELRYAEISREMLASGDWVVPHFFDLRYFEKPVAGYWINNLGQWLFGHSNFGVRFGSVLAISLTALLVMWMMRRVGESCTTALTAGGIFLTSLLVYGVGTYAVLDPMITLWLVAAMVTGWEAMQAVTRGQRIGWWLLLGVACGMGFMTKGFLALAVPVVAVVPWALWQGRWRTLLGYGPLAVLSAAAVSAPWALAIHHREPFFWHYFFWVEHIQRFAEDNAQHKAPFWYYLPVLLLGALPWAGLLPAALRTGWQSRRQQPACGWLFCWLVMPLLFFSIAKGKLPTYILPCFAPLAMLMACAAARLPARSAALRANALINLLFGLLCAAAVLLVLAPWGVTRRPVYGWDEMLPLLTALIIFLGWALVGLLTLRAPDARWRWAAACPLALALLVGTAIPGKVRDSKQPEAFVDQHLATLQASRFVLANNPGIASSLAWALRRSDVLLFQQPGEVRYGLSYADAAGRFIPDQDFVGWLQTHRRAGSVALLMKLGGEEEDRAADALPPADAQWRQGRLMLLFWRAQP
ncbi:lipid IV(A) 4-amino-4-deoxy-L-arabinosyltransferase [Pantoea sp. 1.19]|uniref:lipid IV(A) 4-amino-4-deoxy-L-arabinosyltransferase n=1 Tax=Pantoea sp. 1.19 TaxID=1925589 RepID=UPI0009491538|nr:lipid IV(A) 4-amino-4-deoxy-L-arabinosyltransferase [Pantoea sp. 1.19]